MKILTAAQIREADQYTIAHEPIASIDLMERASKAFTKYFLELFPERQAVYVFCGMGNNGGDGLAVSRLLLDKGYTVYTYLLYDEKPLSPDAQTNLDRLTQSGVQVNEIKDLEDIPAIPAEAVVIDALFGTGLSRPLEGLAAAVVKAINHSSATVVALDVPSGLFTDKENEGDRIIQAKYTLTFQFPKLSFLLCQNAQYVGQWQVVDIGLHPDFISRAETPYRLIDKATIQNILRPRAKCSHKGTYGHALFIGGSYGKIGAALLGSIACLRSGIGLLTTYIPKAGYHVLQTALPEAMVITDPSKRKITRLPDIDKYDAIGFGPGIGTHRKTNDVLLEMLRLIDCPLVIDADGLNILAQNKELLHLLPKNVVLTPHPKEFERLTGPAKDDWHRLEMAREFAQEYNCILVLKSAYTSIHLPNGEVWFNHTGNPGMATGGTGDALTGIITALLAQGYPAHEAAALSVYLHGRAGDIAAAKYSQWSMLAGDLINCLGEAFLEVTPA